MEQTLLIDEIKSIYDKLVELKYSNSCITIYFFVKYYININTFEFAKKINPMDTVNKRFNSKCIITDSLITEICYFTTKKSNSTDINNCFLLNKQHSEYFNKYIWSINPETFDIEINYDFISLDDIFIKLLENKNLDILKQYPEMIENITEHYEIFLNNVRFSPSKEEL
jgi:hypothetical protein